jgi:hypothetical protein
MEDTKEFDYDHGPPKFILEWFLNSLLPYISKDVMTLRVFTEEQVIFREQ